MSAETHLHSRARQARRAKKELELIEEERVVDILDVKESEAMIRYPSNILSTEFITRLPEWRYRAITSLDKEHWRSWYEYQFVILSMSLGFSNFIYFPMYAAKYGAGTFVICFIVTELVIGFPILFLQLAVGQFNSKDITRTFAVVPFSAGVGYSLIVYNIVRIIRLFLKYAWIVYFMYSMMEDTSATDWDDCKWNNADNEHFATCRYIDINTLNSTKFKCIAKFLIARIEGKNPDECAPTGSSLFSPKAMHWPLVISMVLVHIVAYFFIFKGIKSVEKAVLWVIPIICFFIIVFLATDLFFYPRSLAGIQIFFTPHWNYWIKGHMWYRATSLVFTSLSLDTGAMIIVGSYARFKSSAHVHAFYVCLTDICIAVLAGSIVSGYVSVITQHTSANFQKMVDVITIEFDVGYFIIMTAAINKVFTFVPLWTAIFFLSVLATSLTTQAGYILLVLKTLHRFYPSLKKRQWLTNIGVMAVIFLLTLPFLTTGSGAARFMVELFQYHPTVFFPLVSTFVIVTTFVYGYGLTRIRQDIHFMIQYYPNKFFTTVWMLTPCWIVIMVIVRILEVPIKVFWKPDDEKVVWGIFSLLLLPTITVALWKTIVFVRKGDLCGLFYSNDEYNDPLKEISHITSLSDDDPDSHQRVGRHLAQHSLQGVRTTSNVHLPYKKRVSYNVDDGGGSSSSADESLRRKIRIAARRNSLAARAKILGALDVVGPRGAQEEHTPAPRM